MLLILLLYKEVFIRDMKSPFTSAMKVRPLLYIPPGAIVSDRFKRHLLSLLGNKPAPPFQLVDFVSLINSHFSSPNREARRSLYGWKN